jgi:hypothetical protein
MVNRSEELQIFQRETKESSVERKESGAVHTRKDRSTRQRRTASGATGARVNEHPLNLDKAIQGG